MKHQKKAPGLVFVEPEEFYIERRTACLDRREATNFLGVTVRTVRNWENGSARVPYSAFRLIRMRAGGIVQAQGWDGWRFGRDGTLYSPAGRSFLPWQLEQLSLVFRMAEHFIRLAAVRREGVGASVAAPPPPRLQLVWSAS